MIVSSRRPTKFLSYAKSQGVRFRRDKEKPWLRRAKVGFHHVIIVVCRDLPLEERYYNWLIFAPSNSPKWKDYLQFLVKEDRKDLLEIAQKLRPKEFKMKLKGVDVDALLAEEGLVTPPELQAEIDEADEVYLQYRIKRFKLKQPKNLGKILSNLKPEERLAGLKPEERKQLLKQLLEEQDKDEQS